MGESCIFEPIFDGYPSWKVYAASQFGLPDHTTHSLDGHYYGLDFSIIGPTLTRKRHQIQSRKIDGSKIRCLKFSYFLSNVLPNTTLYYEIEKSQSTTFVRHIQQWQVAGSTDGIWFTHITPLPHSVFDLRMGIDTTGEPKGKVFVDDIDFSGSSCYSPHNCDFEVYFQFYSININ